MSDPEDAQNLELDVDTVGRGETSQQVARVCVASANGFTRSGSAPILSADCRSFEALEREVRRLQQELDRVLEGGRTHFLGEGARHAATRATPAAVPAGAPKPRLPAALTVAEVMTREVKTVARNDRVSVADEIMRTGRFRHLVVLGEDGTLAGVVSHRDIFFGALAWNLGVGKRAHQSALESRAVKDVMTTSVVTCEPTTPLAEAAALMLERKIGCLPVLAGEKLVGILTEGDFLALLSGS